MQVYDVATMKLIFNFDGHHMLVYELAWSADDTTIVSCASDCTAKVWLLNAARAAQDERNSSGCDALSLRTSTANLSSTLRGSSPFCTVLNHPSYVYSCALREFNQTHISKQGGRNGKDADGSEECKTFLLVATSCCDGFVYLWNTCIGQAALCKVHVGGDKLHLNCAVNAVAWGASDPVRDLGSVCLYTGALGSDRACLVQWCGDYT